MIEPRNGLLNRDLVEMRDEQPVGDDPNADVVGMSEAPEHDPRAVDDRQVLEEIPLSDRVAVEMSVGFVRVWSSHAGQVPIRESVGHVLRELIDVLPEPLSCYRAHSLDEVGAYAVKIGLQERISKRSSRSRFLHGAYE